MLLFLRFLLLTLDDKAIIDELHLEVLGIHAGNFGGDLVRVLPANGQEGLALDRILVGWNGSREAVRAIFDSIPLLQQADEVLIAFACADGKPQPQAQARREGLVRALLRHGVHARAIDLDSARDAGKVLLEKAETREANLLVMGAYGHARLREFVLGGATRSVLKGMQCPVLFSH